jgi:uncharacterized protein
LKLLCGPAQESFRTQKKAYGVKVSRLTMSRKLKKIKMSYQKPECRYYEADKQKQAANPLAGAAFIAFLQNGQISRQILLSRGRETVALTLKARFKSNTLAAILELGQQGLGIACLPRFICKEAMRSDELQEVLRGWRTPIRLLNIVTPGKQKSSPVVEAFQKYLGSARTAQLSNGGMLGVRATMHDGEKSVTRAYVLVEDIEAAVAAAAYRGAVIAVPPMKIAGHGTCAIFFHGGIEAGLWQL